MRVNFLFFHTVYLPISTAPSLIIKVSANARTGSPFEDVFSKGAKNGMIWSLAIHCSNLGAPVRDWRPAPMVDNREPTSTTLGWGQAMFPTTKEPPMASPNLWINHKGVIIKWIQCNNTQCGNYRIFLSFSFLREIKIYHFETHLETLWSLSFVNLSTFWRLQVAKLCKFNGPKMALNCIFTTSKFSKNLFHVISEWQKNSDIFTPCTNLNIPNVGNSEKSGHTKFRVIQRIGSMKFWLKW